MYSLGIYSWHPPVHHIWYSSNWNGSPSGNIQPWSWGQNISPPAKYSGRTPLMFCRSCQSQPRCGKLLAQILEKSCVMLPAIYKFIDFLFDLLFVRDRYTSDDVHFTFFWHHLTTFTFMGLADWYYGMILDTVNRFDQIHLFSSSTFFVHPRLLRRLVFSVKLLAVNLGQTRSYTCV